MKEHPMLFSTPMVQAILEGRKSQTRRIIKRQPTLQGVVEQFCKEGPGSVDSIDLTKADLEIDSLIENCKWKVGDFIWVRETFRKYHPVDENSYTDYDKTIIEYAADRPEPITIIDADGFQVLNKDGSEKQIPWKRSIHMPKEAARIWLKVTDVRVEQLQDISEEDAKTEGVVQNRDESWRDYFEPTRLWQDDARASFISLWQSINGRESWDANPWVWVVSFDVISTTGRPENQ